MLGGEGGEGGGSGRGIGLEGAGRVAVAGWSVGLRNFQIVCCEEGWLLLGLLGLGAGGVTL